jgi:hypothetical protein
MPKKRGSLHNRIAAAVRTYNQPAALSFNLDFDRELLMPTTRVTAPNILAIALESKIANLKSQIRIPRGVTVTQRPLEALFLVRIQAG